MKIPRYLLVLFACLLWPGATQAKPLAVASYKMKVRLFPKQRTVKGTARLLWHNRSSDRVKELHFHLYMNAFRNDQSSFLRELRKMGKFSGFGRKIKKNRWGWTRLSKIVAGGVDVTQKLQFISPDDQNPRDRTVFKIVLDKPVEPGKTITVDMAFETRLPWAMFRTGYRRNYYFVGQWYPKIGVYEAKGVRGAKRGRWNCHQYHLTTEYYSDFGNYRVELTVPSKYVVGATGQELKAIENARQKTTTYSFLQEGVHDFAWTAYPRYRKVVRKFVASKEVSIKDLEDWSKLLGVPKKQLALKDVEMIFLMQPSHMHLLERHVKALKESLKFYGLWFMPYPYATITLVDPAYEGSVRGWAGMEYATMFTAGTKNRVHPRDRSLEGLIVHEYGHQYFQGIVASNEFEEAWLDEGINSYTNGILMDRVYNDALRMPKFLSFPVPMLGLPAGLRELYRLGFLLGGASNDPIRRESWKFRSARTYGQQVYLKAATMLQTLENILGKKTMARAMRAYVQTWKFKHPSSQDFVRVMEKVSGRDLKGFFKQFLYGTQVLDYAVTRVTSRKWKKPRGHFEPVVIGAKPKNPAKPDGPAKAPAPRRPTTTPGKAPSSRPSTKPAKKAAKKEKKDAKRSPARRSPAKVSGKAKKKHRYVSLVTVQRKGSGILPVEIKFVFEDKKVLTRTWDGRDRWKHFRFVRSARLEYAQVDPQYKYHLDIRYANNSRLRKANSKATLSWFLRCVGWIQHLLLLLTHLV